MKYQVLLVFALVLAPTSVLADSLSLRGGLGLLEGKPTPTIKAFGMRLESQSDVVYPIYTAGEAGLWTDTGSAEGRSGSGFGAFQVGVRPCSEHMYVKAFVGPAYITAIDSVLGGPFQFKSDLGVGFKDRDSFVGLNVSHFSSAGIYPVNKGRDAIQLELGILW
jgi:hypothetical protein